MARVVVVIATLDTKPEEARFIADQLGLRGAIPLIMDVGIQGAARTASDISREQVAAAADVRSKKCAAHPIVGRRSTKVARGARRIARGDGCRITASAALSRSVDRAALSSRRRRCAISLRPAEGHRLDGRFSQRATLCRLERHRDDSVGRRHGGYQQAARYQSYAMPPRQWPPWRRSMPWAKCRPTAKPSQRLCLA